MYVKWDVMWCMLSEMSCMYVKWDVSEMSCDVC